MLVWLILVYLTTVTLFIECKGSLSFTLPAIGPFRSFVNRAHTNLKHYSGRRLKNDSIRMVYYYDQTVAVVELEPDKLLLNCELIEVYEPSDAVKALGDFTQTISPPVAISFKEMITLMHQCQQLEEQRINYNRNKLNNASDSGRNIENWRRPWVLFSGIIPGTKWCGTGDIAKDYYDLGSDPSVDRCCRMHDLCPVKVRAFSNRYNLTNDSIYTKSHCICDDDLFNCLKLSGSSAANFMGNVYFNVIQVPCLEDTENGRKFTNVKNVF